MYFLNEPFAEILHTRTVKTQPTAIQNLVSRKPTLLITMRPITAQRQRNQGDEPRQEIDAEQAPNTAVEHRLSVRTLKMRMFRRPPFHIQRHCENPVDSQRDERQQPPQHIASEQLHTFAVERQPFPVDIGVFRLPTQFPTPHRGIGETERKQRNQPAQQPDEKICERPTRELAFARHGGYGYGARPPDHQNFSARRTEHPVVNILRSAICTISHFP